jgi:hypothetical protein
MLHKNKKCYIVNKRNRVVAAGDLDVNSSLYVFTPLSFGISTMSNIATNTNSVISCNSVGSVTNTSLHAFAGETKAEAISILHNICHYSPARLQELVKQQISPWNHPSQPTNFIKYAPELRSM